MNEYIIYALILLYEIKLCVIIMINYTIFFSIIRVFNYAIQIKFDIIHKT